MFFSDEIIKRNKNDVAQITKFLDSYDVKYDFPEKTFVIRDKGEIIATGSVDGNILKYFFAKEEYKGQGLMMIIYNSLLNYLVQNGRDSFFVFTKPKNKNIFESLGLKEVHETDKVALFEGGFYNYKQWIDKVNKIIGPKIDGKTRGSIIMNCNPMTLGHKYLIETASNDVDELVIFLVEEDKSVFPFKDRFEIVKNEVEQFQNVTVIPGGAYIISQGTFPTYFLKEKDDMLKVYTDLDGSIFAEKIAKDLKIDKRFLGTEPTDEVTLQYNNSLKEILSRNNIEVDVIERKKLGNNIISASHVRSLLKKGEVEQAKQFLPKSTIDYLDSERGQKIIHIIKQC